MDTRPKLKPSVLQESSVSEWLDLSDHWLPVARSPLFPRRSGMARKVLLEIHTLTLSSPQRESHVNGQLTENRLGMRRMAEHHAGFLLSFQTGNSAR